MTSSRIWIDDVRPAPQGYLWVKDYESFISVLDSLEITEVSFDHDLGLDKSGYDCAKEVESRAYRGLLPRFKWAIHSGNPVGVFNIEMAMLNAESYWKNPPKGFDFLENPLTASD